MLPPDDLLRRLPVCVPPADRLRFETILFAHDLMEIALNRLYAVGLEYEPSLSEHVPRLALFSDAWTIVDQVHVVRQVLLSLTGKDRKPDTQAYLDDFSNAQAMRNKMDHLHQNLDNQAGKKGIGNALFGNLSFFRPDPGRWEAGLREHEVRGDLFLISAAAMPKEMVGGVDFQQLDIHLPVCSFKLEAFGLRLLLELAVWNLRPVLRRMSDDLALRLEEQVDEIAAANGCTRDDLLQSASGHVEIKMDFGFEIDR